MRSRRIDEQMAVLVESLRELRGDVRAVRMAIETGVAAHARHVARGQEEQEMSSPELLAGTLCVLCGKEASRSVGRYSVCGTCDAGLEHL
jgi:hypothetical protein